MNKINNISKLYLSALALGLTAQIGWAEPVIPTEIQNETRVQSQAPLNEEGTQKSPSAWSLYLDNDLFANQTTDRDYTGGISFTYSGQEVANSPLSLTPWVAGINRLTGIDNLYKDSRYTLYNLEVGLTAFTPSNIASDKVQNGDRPYASLIYLSGTQEHILAEEHVSWISTLTIGALGLDAVSDLQDGIHKVTGSETPNGWDHQISKGGDPTFRYSLSRQKHYIFPSPNLGVSSSTRVSVGYITEASYGGNIRFGKIRSPWWTFNPNQNQYVEKSKAEDPYAKHVNEVFVWAGFNAKLRLYNALLQGQFRNSPVTFGANDLEPVILEAWLGVTKEFETGLRVSYVFRKQSSEVKSGTADRSQTWGGFILSQTF